MVLVHEERGPQQRGRLVGLTPITLPKRNFSDFIARGFEHKFAALACRSMTIIRAPMRWR